MDNIIHINPGAPERSGIEKAARILRDGGVIAYPTETVYGIGCSALNARAVERIYNLKYRDQGKSMILITSDIVQMAPWLRN